MLISNRTLRILAPSFLLFAAPAFAASISGTVTDRTTGKPSAGDTIAVINTAQSMDEIAKVTSDAQGKFQVNAPDGGQILLHVTHGGAEYFKSVPPGSNTADIDVYDSAKKIDGITGEAVVLRAETDPSSKTLNVSENFFVQNNSAPQRTEYGANTYDFNLPKGAQVAQALASSPGGLPTSTKLVTVDAVSGHYAFTFPIRPGETRFQVDYTVPYSGKQPFALKLSMPTNDVAVMLPNTMQLDGGSQFQSLNDPDFKGAGYDDHQPSPTQPVAFTITGTGQLPPDLAQGGGGQGAGQPDQTAASGQRPGGGLGAPDDPNAVNDPWAKYKWWIVSILGLALIAGAGIMLGRSPAAAAPGATMPPPPIDAPASPSASWAATTSAATGASGNAPLLQALKDELFELETDRLNGKLTDAQYSEHKTAFDVVLRRALNR